MAAPESPDSVRLAPKIRGSYQKGGRGVDKKDNPTPPAAGAGDGAPQKDQKGKKEDDLWGAKRASVNDLLAASRGDVAKGDAAEEGKPRATKPPATPSTPSTVVPPSARAASSGTVSESAPKGDAPG